MIIRCSSCGKSLKVDERFAGKRVKCPCDTVLLVPAAETTTLSPSPSADTRQPASNVGGQQDEMSSLFDDLSDNDMQVRPSPARTTHQLPPADPLAAYAGAQRFAAGTGPMPAATRAAGSSNLTNGSTITGILMMIGAVVWFFGGLAAGIIFFYPPILFILGLIAMVKGLMGGDD